MFGLQQLQRAWQCVGVEPAALHLVPRKTPDLFSSVCRPVRPRIALLIYSRRSERRVSMVTLPLNLA